MTCLNIMLADQESKCTMRGCDKDGRLHRGLRLRIGLSCCCRMLLLVCSGDFCWLLLFGSICSAARRSVVNPNSRTAGNENEPYINRTFCLQTFAQNFSILSICFLLDMFFLSGHGHMRDSCTAGCVEPRQAFDRNEKSDT